MYTIFLNHVDNRRRQYYNGRILVQQFLNEMSSLIVLCLVLPSNFIVSEIKSSR